MAGDEVVEVVRTHSGHAHSHGHGHGGTCLLCSPVTGWWGVGLTRAHTHVNVGNVNVRAALIHVIGDCIQSVGIIGAAVVVWVRFYLPACASQDGR